MERIDVIERLCKSLSEATGERPSDEFLAEMLVPSLDIHILTEVDSATTIAYDSIQKENIRRAVDRQNCEEVREFILKKQQQRETLLQPIVPKKMDVSNVEAYGAAQAPTYAEAARIGRQMSLACRHLQFQIGRATTWMPCAEKATRVRANRRRSCNVIIAADSATHSGCVHPCMAPKTSQDPNATVVDAQVMCGRIVLAKGEANTSPQRRERATRAVIKARV